jgi:hypothetical protein
MAVSKLQDLSPLDNPEYDCNYCYYKKNMDDPPGTVSKKSDGPSYDQDDCDDV